MAKKTGLGRGLDSLLGNSVGGKVAPSIATTNATANIDKIKLDDIETNPYQPRKEFDEESLSELAESIRQQGVITPITVRMTENGNYQLIAGERRLRAAKIAQLTEIPAYIRVATDQQMMEMALVENIQREDLNALEIALAYQHLIEQYGLTQEKLSERVGKNRATVTNYLRLLKLPATIQVALKNKDIDMGHARALLTLTDPTTQLKVFSEIKKQKLSVRKVEEMVKELSEGGTIRGKEGKRIRQKGSTLNADFSSLQNSLCKFFQTKVKLTCSNNGKGKISIPFSNEEELAHIMELFDQLKN